MSALVAETSSEPPPAHDASRTTEPSLLGRRTYIVGSVIFVVIGALHTVTHLTELSTRELQERFDLIGDIDVSNQTVAAWDLWQGTSLLMGFFGASLGLANLGALRSSHDRRPPIINCLTTIAMLVVVTWVGWAYLGPLQAFGGPFGIVLFTVALVAGRTQNSRR